MLLGFIRRRDRHRSHAAHHSLFEAAMGGALPPVIRQTVRLFDAWKDPAVVADIGFVFPRFRQLTGSCVGAGGGQALFTLIAVQRLLSSAPAFVPFWPFDYGRCRTEEGDIGQGEGAMGSSFAHSVMKDGVLPAGVPGLPAFSTDDGLVLTPDLEMRWSDGNSALVLEFEPQARQFPVKGAAVCRDSYDVKAAITNGYPVTFACDNYVGRASVQGTGTDAAVVGYWDSPGGHQQSVLGYWENASLGPLFWVQNNWSSGAYPADPAGGPPCGCWVTEARLEEAMKELDAEVYALSHLTHLPAQNTGKP
jgi:hypothetical protein